MTIFFDSRMWRSKVVLTFFLLSFMLPACSLPADTASVGNQLLEEVRISAPRLSDPVAATVPVQHVDLRKMSVLGLQSLAEALTKVAGVTVKDYGGAGGMKTISVRGIGPRHTNVAYDGVTLSDCQTGEIDLSRYNLENVADVSLVIGDGTNIFQSARNTAGSALLNIQSRTPVLAGDAFRVKSKLSFGSWQTMTPSLYVEKSFGDSFALSASGEYFYSKNNYPFTLYNIDLVTRERRKNSKMNAGHAEVNACWHPDDRNSLRAKTYFYDNNRELPGIVHLYTAENEEHYHEQNAFAQLQYQGRWGSKWSLMAIGKVNYAMSDYVNNTIGSAATGARYWQREYYFSTALLCEPLSWLSIDWSSDYALNSLNSTLPGNRNPYRHSILQSLAAKGAFARLTIVGRLLYSNYLNGADGGETGGDEHAFSPSLSLSFKLLKHENIYFRAFYKEIFRMPTFNELYFYHIGSTDLKPERTKQLNAGLTFRTHELKRWNISVTADGYVNSVSDKIIAIPYNMFVWHMMNLARVKNFGIDLTFDVRRPLSFRHAIELMGNYSWQKAENRTNKTSGNYRKQIAYMPLHTFSSSVVWYNPWVNLSLTVDGMTERWTTNNHARGTRLAGFAETGMHLFRSFGLWRLSTLTTTVTLKNIFDKQYELVGNYPMPGRSWRLSITYEF